MTLDEVNAKVAKIREAATSGDDESAHSMEDDLHYAVLCVISELGGPAGELAAAALATSHIDFYRWCS